MPAMRPRLAIVSAVLFILLTASVTLTHAWFALKNPPSRLMPRSGNGIFDILMPGSRERLEPFREVSDYTFRFYRDRSLVVPASRWAEHHVWGGICGFVALLEYYDDSIPAEQAAQLLRSPHKRIKPSSGELEFVFVEEGPTSGRLRILTHNQTRFLARDEPAEANEGGLR